MNDYTPGITSKTLADVDSLLTGMRIRAEPEVLPEVVRRLRAARLKRRLDRIEASKGRAGDNHYKRKRMKRREEYHKYDMVHRRNRYQRQFKTAETRYKRARELWAKRGVNLADCMSLDEFRRLMEHKPAKVRELYPHIITDSKRRNLHEYPKYDQRYRNRYPNEDRIIDMGMYKIVRNDTSRAYTLDNVIVLDQYTGLVYYDSICDSI